MDSIKEGIKRNVFKKGYKNNKCLYGMLKDSVLEDKKDVATVKLRRIFAMV